MADARPRDARDAALRIELFVDDMGRSLEFYRRVLRFRCVAETNDGYTPLERGAVRIALNERTELPQDHPIQRAAHERVGGGVEIVLEVHSVEAMYRHVVAEGWPRSAELMHRPWGLTDFRVTDPDGYYWRVTSRQEGRACRGGDDRRVVRRRSR